MKRLSTVIVIQTPLPFNSLFSPSPGDIPAITLPLVKLVGRVLRYWTFQPAKASHRRVSPAVSKPVQVEKELSNICSSILTLLDEHLILTASTGESKVFYLKMKGDYHRYLAEFKTGTDRKEAAEYTLAAYKSAQVPPIPPAWRKVTNADPRSRSPDFRRPLQMASLNVSATYAGRFLGVSKVLLIYECSSGLYCISI